MSMSFLKILMYIMVSLVILLGVFLLYFTLTDYRPEERKTLAVKESPDVIADDTVSVMIWNVGYAGLGDDMSFFYDGGDRVRTSSERVRENLDGITGNLARGKQADFYLFQEVDVASKRSHNTDQFKHIHTTLSNYHGYFALNYQVQFVPIPPSEPLGKVTSGLATYSSRLPSQVVRHDLPGSYGWPRRLFMLDRCFMTLRFPVEGGGELVLVNTHNSAYDDGELKKKEMARLKSFVKQEYQKGNYVIAGGDWNQAPPYVPDDPDLAEGIDTERTTTISSDFLPGDWKWVYDPRTPTNRSLETSYKENVSKALIDFYLVSPNISPVEVFTQPLDFRYSDHQPVWARFQLQ